MSIEAMRQALEALEWASDHIPQQKEPVCDCPICIADAALRQAIEQASKPLTASRNHNALP